MMSVMTFMIDAYHEEEVKGEEILPGIRLEADGGVTGNFRVLCDGEHEQEGLTEEEEQAVDAIATQALPAIAPGLGAGPREY